MNCEWWGEFHEFVNFYPLKIKHCIVYLLYFVDVDKPKSDIALKKTQKKETKKCTNFRHQYGYL